MSIFINSYNLQKSYGSKCLFTHISLGIFAQERLGLIGPNGSGKSTLLKILAGLEAPDDGKVDRNTQTHVVYLGQQDHFDSRQTVKSVLAEALGHQVVEGEYPQRIWEVTGENLFSDLSREISTLSGGWRKRLAIVQALLQKPDLLLLDEPTNHLDLEGILWLERLLNKTQFTFVVVTHDRVFLENTVNTIMELNRIYPEGYFKASGNYSKFLQHRDDFIAAQIQKEQSLANKLRREEEWLRRMPKARTTKAQYRIDRAVELHEEHSKISALNLQKQTAAINFSATERQTKILLEVNDLSLVRNSKTLFKHLSFKLSPGSCLGLLGKNGSGKTSLINLLTGEISPDSGTIKRADNLRMVTFDQKREQLDQNLTLMQALSPGGDYVLYKGNYMHVAAWAKRFLFAQEQLHQPVKNLSGGEKARVLIANLMLKPADILFLDEPTNDLDIETLEVLEDSLKDFPGALVLITHDRFLLDRLSDRLLYLAGDGSTEFFADFSQWQTATEKAVETSETTQSKPALKNKAVKKLSYDEQRELSRIPAKIDKAEAEIAALELQLEKPDIQSNPTRLTELCLEIQIVKNKVNQLYERWEELERL
ncbi:MAG TPA: ABC-F family ATP-binding cassette domain-containing protein [Gammaproteobacteria bacterium]|nr:ABC-F family ATP-binding cassette domain-containing protein [Gammaproteobacteria bacterium]